MQGDENLYIHGLAQNKQAQPQHYTLPIPRFTKNASKTCIEPYTRYTLDLTSVCPTGCTLTAAQLETTTKQGTQTWNCTVQGTTATCKDNESNQLTINQAGTTLTITLPETLLKTETHGKLQLTLLTPSGTTLQLTPITITLRPLEINTQTITKALQNAADANNPQQAQQAIQQTILHDLTSQYGQIKPATSLQTIPTNCHGIPIKTKIDTTSLQTTLLTLAANGKPANYALCAEYEKNHNPILPTGKCIGSYIDKRIVKEVFSGKTLTAYATACTIATTICELKWFGVGWMLGLGEGLIGCGLPASMGYLVRGKIAQNIKKNGSLSILQEIGAGAAAAGAYTASSVLNGILYTTTLRNVVTKRAAQELVNIRNAELLAKTNKEVKVPTPRIFYTKKYLENTVDTTFRSLTGTSLSPEAEAKVLASLEPKDYKVLAYVCQGGCDTETLTSIVKAENPRDEIYAKFIEKYWASLKGVLEGRISKLGEVVSKKIEAAIEKQEKTILKETMARNWGEDKHLQLWFGTFNKEEKEMLFKEFIEKGHIPTDEEIESFYKQLEERGIVDKITAIQHESKVKSWFQNIREFYADRASRDLTLRHYKNLLELAKEDPEEALKEAKRLGIIKGKEEVLEEAKQLEKEAIGGIKDRFITTTENGKVETPNKRLIKNLEKSEDPFDEMRKQAQTALQDAGIEEAEKITKEAAEEALTEAEKEAENTRQGASLIEGTKRNLACLPVGYLTGTITAALRTGTLNPLSLQTLNITIDTKKNTLTINNLKIG